MLIDPRTAISEGWLTWNDKVSDINKHLQPNALDFDCARIFHLDKDDNAFLSETSKKLRGSHEMPVIMDGEGENAQEFWHLTNGECYDFTSNFHVRLPQGVAAMLIIRSTLNRCGVFLTSGLYDAGFEGDVCGMLRVAGGDFMLAPNTRIGQIKFIRSEDSGILYSGSYSHKQGTHWSEGIKPQ